MTSLLLAAEETKENFASFDVPLWAWGAFVALVAALLIADLLLVHRSAHVISFKEAAIESAVWIAIGLSFTFVVLGWHGGQAAGEYLSGYLIEKSLSVDNVFVWAVIFSFFGVPREFQFRVLFWGIFGALVLRAIFIFAGVALIEQFEWVLYVFGVFLLYTAVKIARHDEAEVHPENNLALKLVRKVIPSTNEYDGQKIFTRRNGKRLATPLFAVLVLIETTDVVFAVDSIPAILAVSREQFIVFSSNAFAILGLRALYFCLAGAAGRFRYLNVGLGVILAFVGIKMLITELYHFPTWLSLVIIIGVLTLAIVASLRADSREHDTDDSTDAMVDEHDSITDRE
ncbi:MAG: Integral rane protein TerC [Acidimicrobiales bacterium]|jgi:tellurite resistance protein TerC|nr:Integral rane protein TerC [Acidimicrobiales bacterium]